MIVEVWSCPACHKEIELEVQKWTGSYKLMLFCLDCKVVEMQLSCTEIRSAEGEVGAVIV